MVTLILKNIPLEDRLIEARLEVAELRLVLSELRLELDYGRIASNTRVAWLLEGSDLRAKTPHLSLLCPVKNSKARRSWVCRSRVRESRCWSSAVTFREDAAVWRSALARARRPRSKELRRRRSSAPASAGGDWLGDPGGDAEDMEILDWRIEKTERANKNDARLEPTPE
ncbi:hypothetical protein PF003_g38920 [Phytophthora fragariae]|nr:hypothetical protein PF003_g38920 [Phytophthora fragariae]